MSMEVRKKSQIVVQTHTTIEDAVKTAMEEAVASTNGSRTKKAGQKVNVSKSDLAMIGDIVAQVMLGLQPLIASVVTSAVTASTRAILADVAESHTQLCNEVASLQKEVRLHRFQLDRLEQYGRRDGDSLVFIFPLATKLTFTSAVGKLNVRVLWHHHMLLQVISQSYCQVFVKSYNFVFEQIDKEGSPREK